MKPLTPKQRREIYLKVAERLSERPSLFYLCGYLSENVARDSDNVFSVFKEFTLFKPKKNEGGSLWWVGDEDYNYDVRIICMLLCSEMCKP